MLKGTVDEDQKENNVLGHDSKGWRVWDGYCRPVLAVGVPRGALELCPSRWEMGSGSCAKLGECIF